MTFPESDLNGFANQDDPDEPKACLTLEQITEIRELVHSILLENGLIEGSAEDE